MPNFNPRTPCGARLILRLQFPSGKYFNPRTPCGARHAAFSGVCTASSFQSTHPLRGATHLVAGILTIIIISIHAPLAGRDPTVRDGHAALEISIHAPLAGRDCFISTQRTDRTDFNPRTPCGARHKPPLPRHSGAYFNPRTPCGARRPRYTQQSKPLPFQSTHPLRGATPILAALIDLIAISIHAPLAGRDVYDDVYFPVFKAFQSTHPLRGATAKLPKYSRQICAKATKFLQSQTKSGVAACWAKGKRPLFPALRGANLPAGF